jgi:tRNA threonylcarbamoyladenosine biosynthesis protein TsaE
MVPGPVIEFPLPDEESARRFGAALGHALRPGMTLLLEGPLGAGKSHIARAAIRALAGEETEVPSPTFTLVQTYDSPAGEIWHADLYRLGGPDEVEELGLVEAMATAIVLVEWPDRLGRRRPGEAAVLRLSHEGDGRRAWLQGDAGLIGALRAGGWG